MPTFDLFEAIHTQRAIRYFRPDPVPDELIRVVLDAAIRAPSGGNGQPWSFLVLKDPETRRDVAQLYKRAWAASGMERLTNDPDPSAARVYGTASDLAKEMAEVPVLIVPCIRVGGSSTTLTTGSSIYPAVQNLMLAARGLGLGTVITTLYKRYETEIKDILGIPDGVETAALVPLGYPASRARFGGNRRRPVEDVTFRDRWGRGWATQENAT